MNNSNVNFSPSKLIKNKTAGEVTSADAASEVYGCNQCNTDWDGFSSDQYDTDENKCSYKLGDKSKHFVL